MMNEAFTKEVMDQVLRFLQNRNGKKFTPSEICGGGTAGNLPFEFPDPTDPNRIYRIAEQVVAQALEQLERDGYVTGVFGIQTARADGFDLTHEMLCGWDRYWSANFAEVG